MTGTDLDTTDDHAEAMSRVVASAEVVLGDPLRWLAAPQNAGTPVAVECWVFDPEGRHVLLVEHRWRGWVPPGGAVEVGELPRDAALRELLEETGVVADLSPSPVLACLRSYRRDWEPSLSFTFAGVSVRGDLRGERGQPCAWTALGKVWTSAFPEDRARMGTFLASRRDGDRPDRGRATRPAIAPGVVGTRRVLTVFADQRRRDAATPSRVAPAGTTRNTG